MATKSSRRVVYVTDIQHRQDIGGSFAIKESKSDIGSYSFLRGQTLHADVGEVGENHVMDPQRLRMVHALVLSLGLRNKFAIKQPTPCTWDELRMFHQEPYLRFLSNVSDDAVKNESASPEECEAYNIGPVKEGVDCTAFEGLWEYNRMITGGSLQAARLLASKEAEIAINWSGGFHHAKSGNAAGFCYVNDIVIAIVELLKTNDRVLYIDIDYHHGDGVEEAFYITNRVCTFSLHRFGGSKVFPGTGDLCDHGHGPGAYHSVNAPLLSGIGDEAYVTLFQELLGAIVGKFQPNAIVLQCGADSLTGDSVGLENGSFNLSTWGHVECVKIVRDLNIPLLVLGGGGYSKESVAKCWAIETAVLCGVDAEELPKSIPPKDFYFEEYKDKALHVESRDSAVDFNTPGRLQVLKNALLDNIAKMSIYTSDSAPKKRKST